jgi:uncharacterized 2Fe-2S/4Fe-4S cluster protein (DUF4445 family)
LNYNLLIYHIGGLVLISEVGYRDITDLRVTYDIKTILDAVECYENNPNYEVHKETLIRLIEEALPFIQPIGYVLNKRASGFIVMESKGFLYCIVTLGEWVDQQIKTYFADYMYLEGMMLNALADNILYEATNELYRKIHEKTKDINLFLTSRYEAGNSNVPMEAQLEIFECMKLEFDIPVSITSGYMLAPSKTLAYMYAIVEHDCSHGVDHDCSLCQSKVCKQRKYKITLISGEKQTIIQGKIGENVLSVLRRHGYSIDAPCSGKRICGKCKVVAQNHKYVLEASEEKYLTEQEKAKGVILACFHNLDQDLTLLLTEKNTGHVIEDNYAPITIEKLIETPEDSCGVAIDIGTTTIALSLIHLHSQKVLAVEKMLNPQRAYGADVISRILYNNQHKDQRLTELIVSSLEEAIRKLIITSNVLYKDVCHIAIAGNTTMIYLLLGIDPEPLAVSPFTTIELGLHQCRSWEIWEKLNLDAKVSVLPWISAYVGGDIVSGMFATELRKQQGNSLLIDIGTNGEMVLKAGERIISASTAAGPAFEGANIRCGMGSVDGAVCEIADHQGEFTWKVLGDKEPLGICGSALIDAVHILLERGTIEPSGFMEKPFMFTEDIGIYPEDVRQVQLAKAAIAAGIEVLLDAANLSFEDVDAVFLAGGFGSHLNISSAVSIGLIQEPLKSKVHVVGNSSLAGCVKFLLENDAANYVESIKLDCEYIELSTNMKFNDAYIMNMFFGGLL